MTTLSSKLTKHKSESYGSISACDSAADVEYGRGYLHPNHPNILSIQSSSIKIIALISIAIISSVLLATPFGVNNVGPKVEFDITNQAVDINNNFVSFILLTKIYFNFKSS